MAVSFNLPDPYEAQKAEIARRQKYAEALQQQAFQPVEQFSYQGIPAPVPIAATLAKILQGAGGAYLSKKAEDEARELREGDIKKGQEFAAALQGAKTPEEKQALAMRAMGGEFGQRGQVIGAGEYQMVEKRAEAERARVARQQEVADRLQAQRDMAAERLANAQMIAGVAAGSRADALAVRREVEEGRREDREREHNRRVEADRLRQEAEANRLPMPVVTSYTQARLRENEAGDISNRMNSYVKDIEDGKLPINAARVVQYRAQNAAGASSPESQRFFSMMSDVNASVDAVLRQSPGTKTEGDAVRARDQILQNPNDADNVKNALRKLAKAQSEVQDIYRDQLNVLGSRYRGLQHDPLPRINPPAAAPQSPPTPPAAPQAPGAAPGQQPAGAGAGLTPEEQRELEALRARFPRASR